MFALLRQGLLLVALCGVIGGAIGAPSARQDARGERMRPATISLEDALRERLRARPPEERARLERHLAEFEKLPPKARAKLLGRARVLRERERSFQNEAGRPRDDDSAAQRAEERARLREHGREVRSHLPVWLRHRLEDAPPELRHRFLVRLIEEPERICRRALARLREHMQLSAREVQRLERLPLTERLLALRELGAEARDGEPR